MSVSRPRQERAQLTRRKICDAAKQLFLSAGYASTTIADIARAARVAPQTVYFVFGSKAALLAAILDYEIVGDMEPVPLLQRQPADRLAQIRDPVRRLQRVVAIATEITQRLAPLYEIVRSGAADPDIGALLERHEEQRWHSLLGLLGALESVLPGHMQLQDAADQLYALLSHDVYWLLVCRRGWSEPRWRAYVAHQAIKQLLPEVAPPRSDERRSQRR
jgi:AcrR family transcriptional regulator